MMLIQKYLCFLVMNRLVIFEKIDYRKIQLVQMQLKLWYSENIDVVEIVIQWKYWYKRNCLYINIENNIVKIIYYMYLKYLKS